MISNSYIHDNDVLDEFMFESYHLLNSITDDVVRLVSMEAEVEEHTIFEGADAADFTVMLEAEGNNVFEKIGNTIIAMFKSFMELIKKMTDKVKTNLIGAKKASTNASLKEAMKANPELANQFLKSVTSGNIKAHDIKDLDEMIDSATKISNDYMNGKLGEKDFNDKIDDTLAKFEKKARPISAILGVASATLGIVVSINKINEYSKGMNEKTLAATEKLNATKEKCMNQAKQDFAKDSINASKLNVWASGQRRVMAALSKDASVVGKITDRLLSFLTRVPVGPKADLTKMDTKFTDREHSNRTAREDERLQSRLHEQAVLNAAKPNNKK